MTVKAHPCLAGITPIVEKKVNAPQPERVGRLLEEKRERKKFNLQSFEK